jgi:hypothetical protein
MQASTIEEVNTSQIGLQPPQNVRKQLLFQQQSQQLPNRRQNLGTLSIQSSNLIHDVLRATVRHHFATGGVLDRQIKGQTT